MTSFDILNKGDQTLALASAPGNVNLFREIDQSIDPTDDQFDFSLWAKAVRKQMVESLQRRNQSKVGTKR